MLIRISLIVAIIGGLAVAGINFISLKDKIDTTISARDKNAQDRDMEAEAKRKAQKRREAGGKKNGESSIANDSKVWSETG